MLKIFIVIILLFSTHAYAGHEKGDPPPKVTTQQYTSWTYQCVEDHGKKTVKYRNLFNFKTQIFDLQ